MLLFCVIDWWHSWLQLGLLELLWWYCPFIQDDKTLVKIRVQRSFILYLFTLRLRRAGDCFVNSHPICIIFWTTWHFAGAELRNYSLGDYFDLCTYIFITLFNILGAKKGRIRLKIFTIFICIVKRSLRIFLIQSLPAIIWKSIILIEFTVATTGYFYLKLNFSFRRLLGWFFLAHFLFCRYKFFKFFILIHNLCVS